MKRKPQTQPPVDADARRAITPVICYPIDTLPSPNMVAYAAALETMQMSDEIIVPPRDARPFRVHAGDFFRIVSLLPIESRNLPPRSESAGRLGIPCTVSLFPQPR